jgi:alpha-tubulin suppressor-like RCC1 family protein
MAFSILDGQTTDVAYEFSAEGAAVSLGQGNLNLTIEVRTTGPASGVVQVSAGAFYTCSLTADGIVHCWGDNLFGQALVPDGRFTSVSCGETHTCALTEEGAIRCWGDDSVGQSTPPDGRFVAISAGYYQHGSGATRKVARQHGSGATPKVARQQGSGATRKVARCFA